MKYLFYLIPFCALSLWSYCEANVRGDLTHSFASKPGENLRGKITIGNDRDQQEEVLLQINDYSFNCNGEVYFEDPGTYPRSNASWLQLHTDRVVIPPKSEVDIFYTIEVPEKITLPGSYWSVILVEPQSPVGPTMSLNQENQVCVNVKIRYANHIITTIGNPQAKLKVLAKQLGVLNQTKVLNVDVANTGEIYLDPKLTLKIYDSKGKPLQTLNAPKQRLYPETSVRYSINISTLSPGEYNAFLILDAGNDHLFGDRFEFKAD